MAKKSTIRRIPLGLMLNISSRLKGGDVITVLGGFERNGVRLEECGIDKDGFHILISARKELLAKPPRGNWKGMVIVVDLTIPPTGMSDAKYLVNVMTLVSHTANLRENFTLGGCSFELRWAAVPAGRNPPFELVVKGVFGSSLVLPLRNEEMASLGRGLWEYFKLT